jgi:hypothetical protein
MVYKNMCYRISKSMARIFWSRDSAVGKATGYVLDDGGVGVRVPVGSRFSLLHVVQTGSGAHPASYPMGTRGSFLGGKAAEAWSYNSPPTSA